MPQYLHKEQLSVAHLAARSNLINQGGSSLGLALRVRSVHQAWWLLLGVVVLGAALRAWRLGAQPLWADEGFSWVWAHLPQSAIWGDAAPFETHPPLFYSLQRLWLTFGDSEAAMRSLPALFGILTVPLVFWLGRLVGGTRVGLVAALLAATSPPLVAYSQEAR